MYGLAGERRLTEFKVGWLPGYEGPAPVLIGNAAYRAVAADAEAIAEEALRLIEIEYRTLPSREIRNDHGDLRWNRLGLPRRSL
jgi:hypothetical protein